MTEQKKTKIKKKEWYPIITTDVLKNTFLGESYLSEPSAMAGRHITVNLMQISNDQRNQNIYLKFLISEIKDNKGIAEIIGYYMTQSYIRRLVRKEKKKLELSFDCNTADGVMIRIKPITIIKKTTMGSTERAIRKNTRDFLTKRIQKTTYNNLVHEIITYKLQDELKKTLKKIFPLKLYEIKDMYVVRNSKINSSEK